jgi:hypothetical protein
MRPLTGCNTIRSRYIPSGTEADGSHAPDGNEATPTPSSATGPGVLSGVDWDWWPQPALDQPYGDASGAGNDLRGDANDCAMLTVAKGVKFHIDGMIYAPTGAIDLSGNDNDASWATDGIIVRHFTAFRWSNTGDNLPAVGGIDMRPTKRTFKLEVHQGGATGLVLASEWVTIDDGTGGPQVGQSVTVKCFAFRSTNCN